MLMAVDDYELNTPGDEQVSENFKLRELTVSSTARRLMLNNSFTDLHELRSAVVLTRKIMQPIRTALGAYTPNSVYRSQELERVLKGRPPRWVSRSQHAKGQACDISILGVKTIALATWVKDNLDFDQLILEMYSATLGEGSGWVHVSYSSPAENRRNVLSYVAREARGRYTYVDGLVASKY